jgi:hypothetical protein
MNSGAIFRRLQLDHETILLLVKMILGGEARDGRPLERQENFLGWPRKIAALRPPDDVEVIL